MTPPRRIILALITVYLSWIAMMCIHESGHVLAAILGGGRVQRVIIPPIGFSRTDVSPNPSPRLEVWAGPVWGSLIPLIAWLILARKLTTPSRAALGFFTGLCLVANGVYLGIGWIIKVGDAGELMKSGTSPWALMAFGIPTACAGLFIWHKLGNISTLLRPNP